jgi:hypothetical protein
MVDKNIKNLNARDAHINGPISERKSAFKVSGNIKSLRRNPNPSFCPFPLYQGGYIRGGKIPRELFMFKGALWRKGMRASLW